MATRRWSRVRNRVATAVASLLLMGMAAPPTSYFHGFFGTCMGGNYFLARTSSGATAAEEVMRPPTASMPFEVSAYAVDPTANRIYVAHSDGGGSYSTPSRIARVDFGSGSITGYQLLVTLSNLALSLKLDLVHGKMYWLESGTGIRRANLDGTAVETIIWAADMLPYGPNQIAVDPGRDRVYYATSFSPSLPVCPSVLGDDVFGWTLDGSSLPFYGWIPGRASGIAVDAANGDLYVADACTPTIHRFTREGVELAAVPAGDPLGWVTSGPSNPVALDLDTEQRKIYWGVAGTSEVDPFIHALLQTATFHYLARANLDGSDPEDVPFGGFPAFAGGWVTERLLLPACDDGLDNDGDSLSDSNDPGCISEIDTTEADDCSDGFDNDGDGLTDFGSPGGDAGCTAATDGSERGTSVCDNGIDDDGDGLVDFGPGRDSGCESSTSAIENPQCQDGIDNDGAAGIDFDGGISVAGVYLDDPDPECSSPSSNAESAAAPACSDGIDNDGDGLVDYSGSGPADWTGCSGPTDSSEKDTRTNAYVCDNGLDDDGDGKIDHRVDGMGDPQCTHPSGTFEASPSTGCGLLGIEGLVVAGFTAAARAFGARRKRSGSGRR